MNKFNPHLAILVRIGQKHGPIIFCHRCKKHENEIRLGSRRENQKNKKCKCTDGQKNVDHPTTKRNTWSQDTIEAGDVSDDDIENSSRNRENNM